MKINKTVLSLLAILVLIAFSFQVPRLIGNETIDKSDDGIQWRTFEQGLAQAKKEKKVLVVDFYTDWCHWCKVMDKETYGNSKVIDYATKTVVMSKLNAETTERFDYNGSSYEGRELTRMFGVTGFPATVFFTQAGEPITVVPGYIPADRFNSILKFIAEGWYDKIKFEEFEKQEANKS